MSQSRRMSLVEAITNTVVGYALAVGTQLVAFQLFGIEANLSEHLGIGAIFVLVSLARSYLLRRAFAGAWRRGTGGRTSSPVHDGLRRPSGCTTRLSEVD